MSLLDKTREISRLIQTHDSVNVDYKKLAKKLGDVISSNVFILSDKGRLVGYSLNQDGVNERVHDMLNDEQFPDEYVERLFVVTETEANIPFENDLTVFPKEDSFQDSSTCIVPISGAAQRLGTLVLGRVTDSFTEHDLVLAEYAATVVGMEMLREQHDEIEQKARDKASITMAINSLSYSEREAITHIFDELDGPQGLLVASKIADRVGITRSVIVNALRKLESAGVIDSKSLGMKGTFIKVKKESFPEELRNLI